MYTYNIKFYKHLYASINLQNILSSNKTLAVNRRLNWQWTQRATPTKTLGSPGATIKQEPRTQPGPKLVMDTEGVPPTHTHPDSWVCRGHN